MKLKTSLFSTFYFKNTKRYFAGDNKDLIADIPKKEYMRRRQDLLHKVEPGSTVILSGAGYKYRTGGIFYRFKQDNDFLYFTGIHQPHAILVMEKSRCSYKKDKTILFMQSSSKHVELWDGARIDPSRIKSEYGIDETDEIDLFPQFLNQLINERPKDKPSIYANLKSPFNFMDTGIQFSSSKLMTSPFDAQEFMKKLIWSLGPKSSFTFQSVFPLVHNLKVKKSASELTLLRGAGQISGRAYVETLKSIKDGLNESVIEATMDYHVRKQGAIGLAYVPVVASGSNALILHYVKNNRNVKDGELVLMDAGAVKNSLLKKEYKDYSSDLTRTFPVNGQFNDAQKELYEAVLSVNRRCIQKCKESEKTTLNELHNFSVNALRHELESIFKRKIPQNEMDAIYPHHVGHWLGMDIHDTLTVSRSKVLEGGHVITIEPGVYVPNKNDYPAKYRGIGIRIEDVIAVGGECTDSNGHPIVLTADAPKEVVDIEAVMS